MNGFFSIIQRSIEISISIAQGYFPAKAHSLAQWPSLPASTSNN